MLGTTALRRRTQLMTGKAMIAVAAVAVLTLGLAQTGAGRSLLRAAGLSQGPETYASLAFSDPQSLPASLPAAGTEVPISFVISNPSANSQRYQWSVVLEKSGHVARLASGVAQVPARGHATVSRRVTASCSGGRASMTVRLANPAESVDFWTACAS